MAKAIRLTYSKAGQEPYEYRVSAEPEDAPGSSIATITALWKVKYERERSPFYAPLLQHQHRVQNGGEDAALAEAEAYLDKHERHAGFTKTRDED
jgi:hypothetical protein